jgi:parallel beta-helix repeat protein
VNLIVFSPADAGTLTLRWALSGASNGDTITFDPAVFPPGSPATIHLASGLPHLVQGNLTVDASATGVILDGSGTPSATGLEIDSDSNTVRGLQILNFPAGGVLLSDGAGHNTIEGNVISSNGGSCGLEILGRANVVSGNLIGTDASGTIAMGNSGHGICIADSADNQVGPGNTIAHNGGVGIEVKGALATGNTITENLITDNTLEGIRLVAGGNSELAAPIITVCTETSVSGTAPPNCAIEVFSDGDAEGSTFEGATTSDGTGTFTFSKPAGLTGPDITATATDQAGNTSAFSPPASVATKPETWSRIKAAFGE